MRLKTITVTTADSAQAVYAYEYKPGTDLPASLAGGGVTRSWGYEGLNSTGRLKSMTTTSTAGTLYSSTYDDFYGNDQRHHQTVLRKNPDGSTDEYTLAYEYDNFDQLTDVTAVTTTGTGTPPTELYDYDGAGNRTGTSFGAPNNLNQYASLVYDSRGNLFYDGHFTYLHDVQDRLVDVEADDQSARVEMGYDSSGRRTWKKAYTWDVAESEWVLSTHLKFAYDGWNLIAEFEAQLDGTNTLLRSYAWGLDLGGGIGGLLSITDHTGTTPATYVPMFDGSGNVTGLADASGAVVASYRYDSFGKLLSATGPAAEANPLRFSTKYFDAETGLYYYGYRYYSPGQGRWISRDPSGEASGANLYSAFVNDPSVRWTQRASMLFQQANSRPRQPGRRHGGKRKAESSAHPLGFWAHRPLVLSVNSAQLCRVGHVASRRVARARSAARTQ
jgi:RHS repeat-associated protein